MAGAGQSGRRGEGPEPERESFWFGNFMLSAAPFLVLGVCAIVGTLWGAGAVLVFVLWLGLLGALAEAFDT